jgi:hypothetical protein
MQSEVLIMQLLQWIGDQPRGARPKRSIDERAPGELFHPWPEARSPLLDATRLRFRRYSPDFPAWPMSFAITAYRHPACFPGACAR